MIAGEGHEGEKQVEPCRARGRRARGRADKDGGGGQDGDENKEEEHGRVLPPENRAYGAYRPYEWDCAHLKRK